jgi:High-affinity nickel-transport protein
MGISFVYGVFHAAGPGHGKAVICSYLLANEETWRRGVVLSFASALLQAATAVAIVAVAAAARTVVFMSLFPLSNIMRRSREKKLLSWEEEPGRRSGGAPPHPDGAFAYATPS